MSLINLLPALPFRTHNLINSLFETCIQPQYEFMMSQLHRLYSIYPSPLDLPPDVLYQSLPPPDPSPLILEPLDLLPGPRDPPLIQRVQILIEPGVIHGQRRVLLRRYPYHTLRCLLLHRRDTCDQLVMRIRVELEVGAQIVLVIVGIFVVFEVSRQVPQMLELGGGVLRGVLLVHGYKFIIMLFVVD